MDKFLYSVSHSYNDVDCIEMKFIGVFSSLENANKAIDTSFSLKGFNQYPRDCFRITEIRLDDLSDWFNGFDENDLIMIDY